MIGGRRALACALLASLAMSARADADGPASRRALLQAAGPAPASPETTWRDLEDVLVLGSSLSPELADGATLPDAHPEAVLEQVGALSCGTALTRAAERAISRAPADRRAAIALLLSPPRLSTDLTYAVPGEPLVIRWDANASSRHALLGRDTDGDRIPDPVSAIADESRDLLRRIGDMAGWDRRPAAGPIEIRLAATPFAEGATFASALGTVVVISRDARGPERLSALAHQLAHAVVRESGAELPPSFDEALATWLGEEAFMDQIEVRLDPARLLPPRHVSRSLLSPGIGAAQGDASFLRFVSDSAGLPASWLADVLAIVPRHAEEARRAGRLGPAEIPQAAVAEALDEVLAHHGSSLAEAVSAHQAWMLEQDMLLRGASVSVDQELDRLPEDLSVRPDDLPPFGQLRFGVQPPPSGGLVLGFDPAEPLRAMAVVSFADGTLRRFPLGEGAPVTLPAASVQRVVVLVQSPSIPRAWSRWPVAAQASDADAARLTAAENPAWPFALESIAAEVQPGQVTLSWDTSSEEDLTGWIVERAVRPAGPWFPLSDAPLPAQAWPDAAASYSFVDTTPRASQRYCYRVRALTGSGLSETTSPTSIRTLPRAR